jgi:crotonobetaine/carnitine-CoA ligase
MRDGTTTDLGPARPEPRLLRGTGPDLGPVYHRAPADERTLLHVLDRLAEEHGDRPWLVFDGVDVLTFAGARDEAHRVAGALTAAGRAGGHVGILLRNRREYLPALLGAQAAGGAGVPLNPELRGPLLATLLRRCAVDVLVTDGDGLAALRELDDPPALGLVVVCGGGDGPAEPVAGAPVTGWTAWTAGLPTAWDGARPRPSDVGALVCTSGTSGGSKAAVCTHHYLYLFSACVAESLDYGADDVLSTPLQLCHVAGLHVFATASLQAGCTAHLQSRFSPSRWWDDVARDGATFTMLMGPMLSLLLDAAADPPPHRLRTAYVLPRPARAAEFEDRFGVDVVWQGWGMTEIFPHTPRRTMIEDVAPDTIGPAPGWVDWGVVDEHDRLVAPGQLGELVYRPLVPDAMAGGYFGDAEATARAFRNFMFHTGDLGTYDEAGHMHFRMRGGDAIRRRGENVSAVELEAVALEHPGIADVAVYAVPDGAGEHEVKLDVVPVADGGPDPAELHAWLAERLPRFMVPRYIERREGLPRTPSQRVEKYKLAADGVDRPEVAEFAPVRRRAGAAS